MKGGLSPTMTTLALQLPGAFLGVGAAIVLGLGIAIGLAVPAFLSWLDDVTAGLAVVIQKIVGWVALAAVAYFGLKAAGVPI